MNHKMHQTLNNENIMIIYDIFKLLFGFWSMLSALHYHSKTITFVLGSITLYLHITSRYYLSA